MTFTKNKLPKPLVLGSTNLVLPVPILYSNYVLLHFLQLKLGLIKFAHPYLSNLGKEVQLEARYSNHTGSITTGLN